MNSLQRENSAKDALIHQAKNEIEKLRKEMREKEITLSQMSAKVRGLWKNRILFWIILTRETKFCKQKIPIIPFKMIRGTDWFLVPC